MEYTPGQKLYITGNEREYHVFDIGQQVEYIGQTSKKWGDAADKQSVWVSGKSPNGDFDTEQDIYLEDLSDTPPQ